MCSVCVCLFLNMKKHLLLFRKIADKLGWLYETKIVLCMGVVDIAGIIGQEANKDHNWRYDSQNNSNLSRNMSTIMIWVYVVGYMVYRDVKTVVIESSSSANKTQRPHIVYTEVVVLSFAVEYVSGNGIEFC